MRDILRKEMRAGQPAGAPGATFESILCVLGEKPMKIDEHDSPKVGGTRSWSHDSGASSE